VRAPESPDGEENHHVPEFAGHLSKGQTMQKAFTAIELLVVLAIVSILAAAAMAVYARRYAPDVVCMKNFEYIGIAFSFYQGDHGYFPTTHQGGARTGALGLGWLREGGYMNADWVFACPAEQTHPEWAGTENYMDALSRGFNRKTDRWHAGTLGFDYDNAMPHGLEPGRAVLADKNPNQHGDGSVVLFADAHAEFVHEGTTEGTVPNPNGSDTDIYQGTPGKKEDCFLNGPDTDDR
jgi:prepilin-type N-terminal cleavage/methylation domain-containing protein/prepilin-type processing-associated H-X9-DG protein